MPTTCLPASRCSSAARVICETTFVASVTPSRIFRRPLAPSSACTLLSSITRSPSLEALDRFLRDFLQRLDDRRDVRRRLGRSIGQVPDLLGDDRESAAGVAGARRFDRRVQRQQVGPFRNQVDRVHDAADVVGAFAHVANHRGRLGHRVAHAAEPLDRPLHAHAALFGIAARPVGDLVGLLRQRRERLTGSFELRWRSWPRRPPPR